MAKVAEMAKVLPKLPKLPLQKIRLVKKERKEQKRKESRRIIVAKMRQKKTTPKGTKLHRNGIPDNGQNRSIAGMAFRATDIENEAVD